MRDGRMVLVYMYVGLGRTHDNSILRGPIGRGRPHKKIHPNPNINAYQPPKTRSCFLSMGLTAFWVLRFRAAFTLLLVPLMGWYGARGAYPRRVCVFVRVCMYVFGCVRPPSSHPIPSQASPTNHKNRLLPPRPRRLHAPAVRPDGHPRVRARRVGEARGAGSWAGGGAGCVVVVWCGVCGGG